jgi:hypothetical protein
LIDKNAAGDRSLYAQRWESVELTLDGFVEAIQRGWAYCPQLSGPRRTENFLACDIASVDIDHGMTVEQALRHPLIKEHALLLYTTVRHTAESHRFRVVFVLPRTITKAGQMVAITRSLTRMLGGDRAAVDATRISYGNRRAEIHRIGRHVSSELLRELFGDATLPENTDLTSSEIVRRRSVIALAPDTELRLADGRRMCLRDTPPKTPVHCPVHDDKRASAVVMESSMGARGVWCSACSKCIWSSQQPPGDFDFDDFVKMARQVAAAGTTAPPEYAVAPRWSLMAKEYREGCKIHLASGEPAPPVLLPGVTFVRSAKGTGKTEALKRLTAGVKKVLLVGHRRTLIRGSCKRLGLSCYLDHGEGRASDQPASCGAHVRSPPLSMDTEADEEFDFLMVDDGSPGQAKARSRDWFGICLDSLLQIRPDYGYDVIIIDESEQVFTHFLAQTLTERGGGGRLFELLRELVRRAKHIIALDADLGHLTFNTLARMVSDKGEDGTWRLQKQLHVWINDAPSSGGKDVQLYATKNHLIGDLMQAIAAGQRCFVVANSKRLIDKLTAVIRHRFGESKRIITITAETGSRDEVKDFVAHAKERAAVYDVILCSPSLGTGVDITFPDNAVLVDAVYGFCEPGTNTHLDFDQQLARVRHPGAVKVWVTPRRFRYETHVDIVQYDLKRAGLYKDLLVGWEADGKPRFIEDDPFIEMAALAKSAHRASQNSLRDNFIHYKQSQGCIIDHVGKNPERDVLGASTIREGQHLREEEVINRIMTAQVLTRPEFERLQADLEAEKTVAEGDVWSLRRTQLELFYRMVATTELIRLDDEGRHRSRVRLFEEVTRMRPEEVSMSTTERLEQNLRFIGDAGRHVATAIVRVLRLTPVWRPHADGATEPCRADGAPDDVKSARRPVAGSFDPDAVFDLRDLQVFTRFMLDNKGALENLLGHEVRVDIQRKPTQQLGLVLGKLGLGFAGAGTQNVSGRKYYRYQLDGDALDEMHEFAARREESKGWAFLASQYGPHMDPSGEDEVEESIRKAEQFLGSDPLIPSLRSMTAG